MAFNRYTKGTVDSDSELILSTDYYLHKTIMQAITSPYKSLENNTFEKGLIAVKLSGFLAEKLAKSNKIITEEELPELEEHLKEEARKLAEEGVDLDSETFKVMLAYSKIAWILERVEGGKASKNEYKV